MLRSRILRCSEAEFLMVQKETKNGAEETSQSLQRAGGGCSPKSSREQHTEQMLLADSRGVKKGKIKLPGI